MRACCPSVGGVTRTRAPVACKRRSVAAVCGVGAISSVVQCCSPTAANSGLHAGGVRSRVVAKASLESGAPEWSPLETTIVSVREVAPSVAVACLGPLLFGYHLAVVNAALSPLAAELQLVSAASQGLVVSVLLAAACVGSFAAGPIADTLGRRKALRVAAVPLLAGAILCGSAASPAPLLVGRFLCGLGLGVASGVVPVYLSEISPISSRGALGSANQLCICVGILAAILAGIPLANDPKLWRSMFYAASVPAAVMLIAGGAIRESPSWSPKPSQSAVSAGSSAEPSGGWGELLLPAHRKATLLAVGLFVIQQFAGINAVVFFSVAVFQAAGVASGVAASALVACVNVAGTLVATKALDAAGRKPLLLASFAGMAAAMAALAACLTLPLPPSLVPHAGALAVIGTVVYVAAFAIGAGPIPSLLVAELFPQALRGRAMSAAMLSHWVCNFGVGQGFLPAVEAIGVGGVYVFFSIVCLLGAIFVALNLPETKGKNEAEIAELLLA